MQYTFFLSFHELIPYGMREIKKEWPLFISCQYLQEPEDFLFENLLVFVNNYTFYFILVSNYLFFWTVEMFM